MKKLLFLFLLIGSNAYSQTPKRIKFVYDSAGNQTQRYICLCLSAKNANDSIYKTEETLVEEDMIQDAEYEQIKYYPNPVLEELYIKWPNTNERKVISIDLFSLNGQLLKRYENLISQNNMKIDFYKYPEGFYNVLLIYENGENKSLKVLKNK
ncbi:T9SS type A sorting domain-containing protein [Flavobacterium terrae]|uniref:Por secretion system C-terminal sorting domain-containing protein n=1 Tax=Flavobacterium terrae TaxID=415425 RepID=A0A1M6DDQ7_9FLAO|nr:T9SS type A sorting domain-containing protein [Flavobacterium terrae]SHI71181.1 Por secretion system C-terminal sorting domain-containing protein [Flavobacterium terrae]